jgi:hypothetical protein
VSRLLNLIIDRKCLIVWKVDKDLHARGTFSSIDFPLQSDFQENEKIISNKSFMIYMYTFNYYLFINVYCSVNKITFILLKKKKKIYINIKLILNNVFLFSHKII